MLTVDFHKATAKPAQPWHEHDQDENPFPAGTWGRLECVAEITVDLTEVRDLGTLYYPTVGES